MKTWQYMWRLIRYRPVLYLIDGMLWTAIHIYPIVPGLIAREFFDTLQGQSQLGLSAWGVIALMLATALAQVVLTLMGALTDIPHRFSISGLLRQNMLRHVLQRPGAQAIPGSAGEALNHFRDDAEQAENAISWTLDITDMTVFALIAIVVLVRVDALMTLLVFGPLVGVAAAAQIASTRVQQYRVASRKATGRVSGVIGEMFGAVQAVKVAGAEDRVIAYFRVLNERRRTAMLRDRLLTQVLDAVFANMVSIGTGLILLVAAQSVRADTFSLGDFALFVYYLNFVTAFTQFFGRFMAHYKQTGVSFTRMAELLQGAAPERLVAHHSLRLHGALPELVTPQRVASDRLELLTVAGLTYRYPGGRGIAAVDFSLRRGSFTVITGRIGSGKTTLLRVLLGLLPADAGEIRWNGVRFVDPAAFFLPPRSAYTSQIPLLFSATVKENMLLGLPDQPAGIERAVHQAVMERGSGSHGAGPGNAGWHARREALGRPGAAAGSGAHVRARS